MSLLLLFNQRANVPAPDHVFGGHAPGVKKRRKRRIFYVVRGDSGRKYQIEAQEIDYVDFSKNLFKIRREQKIFDEEEALLLQMMLEDVI